MFSYSLLPAPFAPGNSVLSDLDGSDERPGPAHVVIQQLSADGRVLAFVRYDEVSGNYTVHAAAIPSQAARTLGAIGGSFVDLGIRADGSEVLVAQEGAAEGTEVEVINVSDGARRRLGGLPASTAILALADGGFVLTTDNGLERFNSAGGFVSRIVTAGESQDVAAASLSLEGDKLAYTLYDYAITDSTSSQTQLRRVPLSGGASSLVQNLRGDDLPIESAWAPGGEVIYTNLGRSIQRHDPDGSSTAELIFSSDVFVTSFDTGLTDPTPAGSDSTAPAPVSGVQSSFEGDTLVVRFTPPADPEHTRTRVLLGTQQPAPQNFRDGILLEEAPASQTEFRFEGVGPGRYPISVFTLDASHNVSGPASTVAVRTAAARVSIAGTGVVNYRASRPITGQVTDENGRNLAGVPVELWMRRGGTTSFVKLSTITSSTATTGPNLVRPVAPDRRTEFQWRYAGNTASGGYLSAASSGIAVVAVVPIVTSRLSATTVRLGTGSTLTGSLAPAQPGQTVQIQRLVSGSWKTVGTVKANSSSVYSTVIKPGIRGKFTYRAYTAATSIHRASASPARTLTVS